MEEALRTRFHELSEQIADGMHVVSSLIEAEMPTQEELGAANKLVAQIATHYAELLAQVPAAERDSLERTHGRRVTDLRRLGSKLPQKMGGQTAKKAADSGMPFLFSRDPPKSIEPPRYTPMKRGEKQAQYRVGGEVESWCGTCGGMTDHAIVAVVDGMPKQVICQTCNARHGYRTAPARKTAEQKAAATALATPPRKQTMTREEAEAKRREEVRFALQKELAEATEVRVFATKQRYKPGEIVSHPEHGRGKIENVLKGSILVRFRDGLKSLSTM